MVISSNFSVPHGPGIYFDFRVEEMNWRQWRSDLGYIQEEDPGDRMIQSKTKGQISGRATDLTHTSCSSLFYWHVTNELLFLLSGNLWSLNPILNRIRPRARETQMY